MNKKSYAKREEKLHKKEERLHKRAEGAEKEDAKIHREIKKIHRKEDKRHATKHKKHIPLKKRKEDKIERVMREFKQNELHSGSRRGPKVKSRKQAIAIALSEARRLKKNKTK